MNILLFYFLLTHVIHSTIQQVHNSTIKLGILFQSNSEDQELIFSAAISDANALAGDYHITAIQEIVHDHDTFQVGQGACRLLQTGVAAIFGPQSSAAASHVQALCDAKDIPHIEIRHDVFQRRGGCSVNLHPYAPSLSLVLFDVIKAWGWTTFTILYEDDNSLATIGGLLQMSEFKQNPYSIVVRQLPANHNYRDILRNIRNSKSFRIVLDCSLAILEEVFLQAQQVGIIISAYSFIVTNLDFQTINLDPIKYAEANITGFRMLNPNELPEAFSKEKPPLLETALLYDAVQMFVRAYDTNFAVASLNCHDENSWDHGYTLINYMKSTEHRGLTGLVKFDNQGFRSDFGLELVELNENGLDVVGTWNATQRLIMNRPPIFLTSYNDESSVANKTFIIMITMNKPYGMLKEDSKQLSGNNRYEGFGIDLIEEMAQLLGFRYIFEVQEDNDNGSFNKKTKQWTGIVRKIMESEADLGITDLTITHERESVVDFTMPFMNLGISILYKKPGKAPPSLFSFLDPFSMEVWMYVLGAYIGVSVLLFIMARISPYEWTNPYPCIEEPEVLENQFSLKNSLWFTIGSLMQQGSEIAPIAISTRMVAGIWWFFTLIMVSSYTANLAAFLTVENPTSPFSNVRELANNDQGIKYGAKKGGSTVGFFKDSTLDIYKKMSEYIKDNEDDVLTSNNDQGVEKVQKENYAFFMESTSIEYTVERICEVAQVGGLLDNKGYGIAMRKNAPYRNALSAAVLKLQENGLLTKLKRKWWKEKGGGGACESMKTDSANELTLKNVGGVFVVLVGGVIIACFITVFEMLWTIGRISRKEKVSFKDELLEELRFVAKCHGSTKPVRKRQMSEERSNEEIVVSADIHSSRQLLGWFSDDEKKNPFPKQPL